MVAVADDSNAPFNGYSHFFRWFSSRPIHLYAFLRLLMDRIDILKTINVLTLALLISYLLFSAHWLLWIACLLVLGNVFESRITAWIAKYWIKFAHYFGIINSKVILSIIFFLVLTPVAFIYRFFNKDMVEHFKVNGKMSYFDNINKPYKKSDFEKVW